MREVPVGREPRRLSMAKPFSERDWYPQLQIPLNPATQRALAAEGRVWTLRAPHAIHPEGDVAVDPARPAAGDKVHSFPARPQMSSQVRAKTITVVAPERPKSAQPNPNVWARRHANSYIDELPNSDPPKDPVFATR